MKDDVGTPIVKSSNEPVAENHDSIQLTVWSYLGFFLLCLVVLTVDKWYGPVSGLIYSQF